MEPGGGGPGRQFSFPVRFHVEKGGSGTASSAKAFQAFARRGDLAKAQAWLDRMPGTKLAGKITGGLVAIFFAGVRITSGRQFSHGFSFATCGLVGKRGRHV